MKRRPSRTKVATPQVMPKDSPSSEHGPDRPPAVVAPGDIRALRDKYERIFRLRTAHERARTDPTFLEPDPRPELMRLAEEFPGALREIDALPLELVEARIERLAAAERTAAAEEWMEVQALFHRLMRGALAAKRWLSRRPLASAHATRAEFIEALPRLRRGEDAALLVDALDAIANPPGGRLTTLVHAKVAQALGITEAEARELVFGPRLRRAAGDDR